MRVATIGTVCVGRAPGAGFADVGHVDAAAQEMAALIQGFTVVVAKSTVPVPCVFEPKPR